MSINYGKSWKRQYVNGKEVVNLTVHVETDKVFVTWDEIPPKEKKEELSILDKINRALRGDLEW